MTKVSNLFQTSAPVRGDFTIPYHDLGPRQRTPRLALTTGWNGNEFNGVFVLARLADFLGTIAAGERPGQRLCERVVIIPAIDVAGLNNSSPARPPAAPPAETLYQATTAVFDTTRSSYYRIDIRAARPDFEEMPQVRLYDPNDDERASACLFGLPAVVEWPVDTAFAATVGHLWRECGGENFVLQSGQAGYLQTAYCETLFHALVAFLDRTGIVQGLTLAEEEDDLHYFGVDQSFMLTAPHPGIFVSRLEVGRWLRAGDPIGHIYDGFSGELRAELIAPVAGLISNLRRRPLLLEGDPIARILTVSHTLRGLRQPAA